MMNGANGQRRASRANGAPRQPASRPAHLATIATDDSDSIRARGAPAALIGRRPTGAVAREDLPTVRGGATALVGLAPTVSDSGARLPISLARCAIGLSANLFAA